MELTGTKQIEKLAEQKECNTGSVWEGLLYVLIMFVVLGAPLLMPGVTIKMWAVGLFGCVILFYIIICLLGIWKNIKRAKRL